MIALLSSLSLSQVAHLVLSLAFVTRDQSPELAQHAGPDRDCGRHHA